MQKGNEKEGKDRAAAKNRKVKTQGVLLTERDLKIIRWVNSHRAVTMQQIAKKFELSAEVVKKRLRRLKSVGYLVYEKLFFNEPGVFMAGAKGVALAGDNLPPARFLPGSYRHDLRLVDLALRLESETGAHWQTERQLRHEKGLKGMGTPGHCPDGILIFPGSDDRIAVELELSPKGAERIVKILKEYARRQYKEVWYFVGCDYLAARIKTPVLPFIRVFSWPDMKEYGDTSSSAATQVLRKPDDTAEERTTAREFFSGGESGQAAIYRRGEDEQDAAREFFRSQGRDTGA